MTKMKTNTKSKLKGVLIGGLLLSAPFAAFSVSNFDSGIENRMGQAKGFAHSQGTLLDEPYVDENYIVRLDDQIEQKVEHANYLIEQLAETDSSVDVTRLYEIVEEFAQLDAELDALNIESAQADDLKEIFFETRDNATALTTEFREIIQEAFTNEQKVELRAQLEQNSDLGHRGMGQYRGMGQGQRFGNGAGYGIQMNMRAPLFNAEVIEIIDSDIATQLENEEITIQEAHDLIKEKMDAMSEDELQILKDEIIIAMPDENFQR